MSRWVRYRSGQKRRARLYRRPLRKNGSFPNCRGRSPDRPAGYDTGAVRKERPRPSRRLPSRCGHRPLRKNGSFPHCRGRSPHRPAGYDTGAVRKDVRGYTVGSRADVGIGPYGKTVRFPTVGDDPQIVPLGTIPKRSEKTYAAIPSAPGPMWASAPTKKRFVSQL